MKKFREVSKMRRVFDAILLLILLGIVGYMVHERAVLKQKAMISNLCSEARALQEKGKYGESLYHLKRILSIDPKNGNALLSLGWVYMNCDTCGLLAAEEALQNSIPLNREIYDQATAYHNLGVVYLRLKRFAEAKIALHQALELYRKVDNRDPYYHGAYNDLAEVYEASGDFKTAEQIYKKALQDPMDKETNALLHHLYAEFLYRHKEYDKAVGECKLAIERGPSYAGPFFWDIYARGDPHALLARIYLRRGNFNAAIDESEKSLKINPNKNAGYEPLIAAYLFKKDTASAQQALERLKKFDTEKANALEKIMASADMEVALKQKYQE